MDNSLNEIFNQIENDNVEVITDEEVDNTSKNVIPINDLVKEDNIKESINVPKKKDKILIIQIILLVTWVVLTVLIYFFGYSIFEPFIKI